MDCCSCCHTVVMRRASLQNGWKGKFSEGERQEKETDRAGGAKVQSVTLILVYVVPSHFELFIFSICVITHWLLKF